MPHFICTACGMQYAESAKSPNCRRRNARSARRSGNTCRRAGRRWTTLEALSQSHMNALREYEAGVIGIGAGFAIGQRALLLRTAGGNVLWDCVATLDAATVTAVKALGGIKAIAISHPHFYTTMVEWAQRLRRAHSSACRRPAMDHAAGSGDLSVGRRDPQTMGRRHADPLRRPLRRRHGAALGAGRGRPRRRLRRRHPHRRHRPQVALLHAQLSEFHSAVGARGRGDRRRRWRRYSFDTLYGHYFDRVIAKDAKAVLEKSIARYVAAVEGKRGY